MVQARFETSKNFEAINTQCLTCKTVARELYIDSCRWAGERRFGMSSVLKSAPSSLKFPEVILNHFTPKSAKFKTEEKILNFVL